MRKNVTYVGQEKFMAIVQEKALEFKVQAGFIRVNGPHGRRVYVANTKTVGRVDISNFTVQFGAIDLGQNNIGAVKQQLDLNLPEADILTNFAALLDAMKELPAPEPEVKVKKTKAAKPEDVQEASGEVKVESDEEKAKKRLTRLQATVKLATSRGGEVSPAVMEEIASLEEQLTSSSPAQA